MTDPALLDREDAGSVAPEPAALMSNGDIASSLDEYAGLLQAQGGDHFRTQAYINAAITIRSLERSLADIYDNEGIQGLIALSGIGESISSAITEMLLTGQWAQLQALNGAHDPIGLFESIPGIGPTLAERLVHEYHIETLHDLNNAIQNSKVHLDGIGEGRKELISAVISKRTQYTPIETWQSATPKPTESLLLTVDSKYRRLAENGNLKYISPARHNPQNKSWLPVMHETMGDWHFTVLYSNTARAHRLEKTHDWVVIHYQKNGFEHGQCTVITKLGVGSNRKRVVKGL